MKRLSLAALAASALGVAISAPAALADIIELGATRTPLVAPSCPPGVPSSACTIILTRVTALETIRDSVAYPTTVTRAGSLVAVTVGLSRLDPNPATATTAVHFLYHQYGGPPEIQVTVLKRVGAKKLRKFAVVANSEIIHVQPYLGGVVQFPLKLPVPVAPGQVVALTTPTWAPVLSIDLALKRFAYRQSRPKNCRNPPSSSQAKLNIGDVGAYGCDYPGTRVEYTATEVTAPIKAKPQIH